MVYVFFFFFQAEDGIRDIGVTGVQTCALPIRCSSPTLALKHANHAFDGNGPAAAYIHVDHAGVEHHRARSNLEPRREAVDETRHDRGRIKADDTVYRTDHPEIGLVGGALGHDPLVRRGDVGVRAYDGADSAVEVDAEGVLLARQFAVEVHDTDRRQWFGGLVDEPVELGEWVLDRNHVRPALEVEDCHLGAVLGVEHAPALPRHAVRTVVERPQDAFVVLDDLVHLALVPDVVARCDHVHAGLEHRLGRGGRQAHAPGHVLAVGRHEVDPEFVP